MKSLRKLIVITLILFIGAHPLSAKINNKEYKQLISQCQSIRARILQENNFATIRQEALKGFAQTTNAIAERFGGGLRTQSALSSLNIDLNALEAQHNLKVNALIVNTVAAFLNTLNTETSKHLLAELIANGFNF